MHLIQVDRSWVKLTMTDKIKEMCNIFATIFLASRTKGMTRLNELTRLTSATFSCNLMHPVSLRVSWGLNVYTLCRSTALGFNSTRSAATDALYKFIDEQSIQTRGMGWDNWLNNLV